MKRKNGAQGGATEGPKFSKPPAVCDLKSKIIYKDGMMTKVYGCAQMTCEEIMARSQRYLDIVAGASMNRKEQNDVVTMTIQNFENFFNRGSVEYRKSVNEKNDYAVAAQMLARGEIKVRGTVPAEIAVDPMPFVAELKKRNMEVRYRRLTG